MRLEDVIITSRLSAPSNRLPNLQNEVATFCKLTRILKNNPNHLLDGLLQAAIDLCRAGSAGLSLLETTPGGAVNFRWTNLVGTLARFVDTSIPRDFSPCGVCLDRNSPQLLACPGHHFEYLMEALDVPVTEALFIPIYIGDQSPGTIWIVSHEESVHFDSEDVRIMTGLAEFAGSTVGLVHALQLETLARECAESEASAARTLAGSLRREQSGLEELVQSRTSEIRELSAQMMISQDEERRRIARDLHDSTGQKIAVLKMDLNRVQKKVKSLRKNASEINECLALATEISDEIRTLSYVLHPPMLDELGLIGAVHVYVEGINKRQMMQVELEVASALGRLTKEVEIALFRVVQAALANVHSHSGSKKATIRITQDAKELTLEIIDRGHGFTSKATKKGESVRAAGVGLFGIEERLKIIGGRLEIETGNHGTILRSVVPVSSFSNSPS